MNATAWQAVEAEIAAHRAKLVAVLETYVRAGVDTIIGQLTTSPIREAVLETEQRTGRKMIRISTPGFTITPDTPANGLDLGEVAGGEKGAGGGDDLGADGEIVFSAGKNLGTPPLFTRHRISLPEPGEVP